MLAALLVTALVGHPASYRIDPAACEAGFDLKATAHTVHGSTTSLSGEIGVTPGDAGVLTFTGKISIGAATLATGNDRRDATMHSKSLLVPAFPTIDLVPERFTPSSASAAAGPIAGTLTGQLTLRGQTRPQSISVTLTPEDGRIVASGTFDVSWLEFGVPDPSFFVVRVEKIAHAHFRAAFVPLP